MSLAAARMSIDRLAKALRQLSHVRLQKTIAFKQIEIDFGKWRSIDRTDNRCDQSARQSTTAVANERFELF